MSGREPNLVNAVVDFWFGELGEHEDFGAYDGGKSDLWFANGRAGNPFFRQPGSSF